MIFQHWIRSFGRQRGEHKLTKVVVVDLDTISQYHFKGFMNVITQERKDRINRTRKLSDSKQFLMSEVLVRFLAIKELNIKNDAIKFGQLEYGKPYLIDYPEFQFNVSHSGKWLVCAYDENPVGIDIEKIYECDMSIAEHFFAKEEYLDLIAQKPEQRLEYFFKLWTLKESYLKALDVGLNKNLNSFIIKVRGNENCRIFSKDTKAYFRSYKFDTVYTLSICSFHDHFDPKFELVGVNSLFNMFL